MKKDILEKINASALALLNANSTKQLEQIVVESAMKLVDAAYGQLYLYNKDRLKKVYSSSAIIKKNALAKHPSFKPYLQVDKTQTISTKDLQAWKVEHLPKSVKSIVVIPFLHNEAPLGYLILFQNSSETLSADALDGIRLLSKTAVMAIGKARLQDESKQALEIRDRFISLASHELRTPLTSLHGYIQLLYARMQGKDSVEARWVKELYVESNRLTTLVKELLDVNRIKQGQFAFVFSEVSMPEVVQKAIEHARIISADHQILFQNKLNDHEAMVVGDLDKLIEMVTGLLGNAVKFSKPEEKITVTLKSSQGMLSLIVRDTGRGISKKDLTAIFEGFYKSAYASHLEGMGVGLLLAKHIMDNHRGKIKITSKEHKGTKVEVLLPIIKSTPV